MPHETPPTYSLRRNARALLPGLTLARVIAMGLIVVGHSLVSYTRERDPLLIWPVFETEGWLFLDAISLPIRNVSTPLFFVLAGISAASAIASTTAWRFFVGRWRVVGLLFLVSLPTVYLLTLTLYRHAWQVTEMSGMSPTQLQRLEAIAHSPWEWGPAHLWFLEFLLAISSGYALVVAATRRWPRVDRAVAALRSLVAAALSSRWRSLLLAVPLLAIFIVDFRAWEVMLHAFIPDAAAVIYHVSFFFLGVCIIRLPQPREILARHCWMDVGICLTLHFPFAFTMWRHNFQPLSGAPLLALQALIAISVMSAVLALLGLCVRYYRQTGAVVQYFAQVSFWVYVAHVPLVIMLQTYLWHYNLPTPLKFFLVTLGAGSASLLLYELFARPGWLGKRLRGSTKGVRESLAVINLRRSATALALLLFCALASYGAWMIWHHNLHQLAAGDIYRSGRLPAKQFEQLITKQQVQHLLVVSEASPDYGWFVEQNQLCQQHGVKTQIVVLPSRRTPTPEQLSALVAALEQVDGPLLIEGRTGANRESVAAAVTELLAGKSPAEARRQFSWRYGYLHAHTDKGPHVFLDRYTAWLAAGERQHSPQQFTAWVAESSALATAATVESPALR